MSQEIRIAHVSDIKDEGSAAARRRSLAIKRLPFDTGIPGVVVQFAHVTVPDGYFTPRHRHNFDQIRYSLKGTFANASGDVTEGTCAYFPEGVHYGPQDQKGECISLTLQFQGPSGQRFLSHDEMLLGMQRLKEAGGTFADGVYTKQTPDGRKVNQDSYEAIWEECVGHELTYPAARYNQPVMMHSAQYRWLPDRDRPGVEVKHLGSFTEYRHRVGFLRLAAGASLPGGPQEDAEIRYVIEGNVTYAGKEHGPDSYFYLPPGSKPESMTSKDGAVIYTIVLPMIAELQRDQGNKIGAAAE